MNSAWQYVGGQTSHLYSYAPFFLKLYTKTSLQGLFMYPYISSHGFIMAWVWKLHTIQRHVCTSAKGVLLPAGGIVYGL